jgi:hypothetical protein
LECKYTTDFFSCKGIFKKLLSDPGYGFHPVFIGKRPDLAIHHQVFDCHHILEPNQVGYHGSFMKLARILESENWSFKKATKEIVLPVLISMNKFIFLFSFNLSKIIPCTS